MRKLAEYLWRHKLVITYVFLIVIFILSLVWFFLFSAEQKRIEAERYFAEESEGLEDIYAPYFEDLSLEAHAVVVYDIRNDEIIFEKRAFAPRPLASLTKIMTALVALEHAEKDTQILLSLDAIRQAGDNGLSAGEVWTLDAIIEFMLVTSSNDAAFEIAQTVTIHDAQGVVAFTDEMNRRAQEMGLATVRFENPSGLDSEGPMPSAFGSAYDIAHLVSHALETYPEIFMASALDGHEYLSLGHDTHIAVNTNTIARRLPALVASKTGYTNTAGGNLAFVFEVGPQRPVAVVVLGSTFQGRFDDARTIMKATIDAIQQQPLLENLENE